MNDSPDITGFREAQDLLRRELGTDVTFKLPVAPVYAAGVKIDPQTGRPYDPLIQPESGGGHTTVVVRASPVFRPIRVNVEDPIGGDTHGGLHRQESVALDIDDGDFPKVQDAVEFSLYGIDYKITDAIGQGLTDVDRNIIFGEAK